jgi:hypothetical protein
VNRFSLRGTGKGKIRSIGSPVSKQAVILCRHFNENTEGMYNCIVAKYWYRIDFVPDFIQPADPRVSNNRCGDAAAGIANTGSRSSFNVMKYY